MSDVESRTTPSDEERAERALKRGRSIGNIADDVAAKVTAKVLEVLPGLIRQAAEPLVAEAVAAGLARRDAPAAEYRAQRTLSGPQTAGELWAGQPGVPVPPKGEGTPCGPDCWHRTRGGEGTRCTLDASGRCTRCGRSAADRAVTTMTESLPDGPAAPVYHQHTFTTLLPESDPEGQTERWEAERG